MLTSKQRAKLRGLASGIDPIFQIGKEGISDAQIKGISDALRRRELVKITVLKSSDSSADQLVAVLADRLLALPVAVIGSKIVLYKRSSEKDVVHVLD